MLNIWVKVGSVVTCVFITVYSEGKNWLGTAYLPTSCIILGSYYTGAPLDFKLSIWDVYNLFMLLTIDAASVVK